MSIKKYISKSVSTFLIVALLIGSFVYMASVVAMAAEWIGDDEEILDHNKGFVRMTAEEKAAADAVARDEAEAKAAEAPTEKAAEEVVETVERTTVEEKAAEEVYTENTTRYQPPVEEVTVETTTREEVVTEESIVDATERNEVSEETSTRDEVATEQTASEESSTTEVVAVGVYTEEVRETITDSLTDAIADSGGVPVEVYIGNGEYAQLSSDSDVAKLTQIDKMTDQVSRDWNNNGIVDSIEVQTTGEITFDSTRKNEAVKVAVYGNVATGETVIVSVPETMTKGTTAPQVVGDKPFLKTKIEPKSGEDASTVKDQTLEIKIYDADDKLVEVQTVITDENGVATYNPKVSLQNGNYSTTTTNKAGEVIAVKELTVEAETVPLAPVIEFKEMNPRTSDAQMNSTVGGFAELNYAQASVLGADVSVKEVDIVQYLLRAYIYKIYPYLDPENQDAVLEAGISVVKGEVPKVVEGSAPEGTVIFVTWKSIVGYSIVMADAKGKFKVEDPGVAKGNHEVIAFVYDSKKNLVGNATSILFKK